MHQGMIAQELTEDVRVVVIGNDDKKRLDLINSLNQNFEIRQSQQSRPKAASESCVHRSTVFSNRNGIKTNFIFADIPTNDIKMMKQQNTSRAVILVTNDYEINGQKEKFKSLLKAYCQLLHYQKKQMKVQSAKLVKLILVSSSTDSSFLQATTNIETGFKSYVINQCQKYCLSWGLQNIDDLVIDKVRQWCIWKYKEQSQEKKNLSKLIKQQLQSQNYNLVQSAITVDQVCQLNSSRKMSNNGMNEPLIQESKKNDNKDIYIQGKKCSLCPCCSTQ